MKESSEKKQYRKDVKSLRGPGLSRLKEKITFGGNVGSVAMSRLAAREFEMNKEAHISAATEQKELRIKHRFFCKNCGKRKRPMFKLCWSCSRPRQ